MRPAKFSVSQDAPWEKREGNRESERERCASLTEDETTLEWRRDSVNTATSLILDSKAFTLATNHYTAFVRAVSTIQFFIQPVSLPPCQLPHYPSGPPILLLNKKEQTPFLSRTFLVLQLRSTLLDW